jgi:sarcosine oxidase
MFDLGVVGLGAVGSMALWLASKTGASVYGVDQYPPGHSRGSSHGGTRIVRSLALESTPVRRSIERSMQLFSELEAEGGRQLFLRTGALVIDEAGGAFARQSLALAEQKKAPVEFLSRATLASRYPLFVLGSRAAGILELEAGVVRPEIAIRTAVRSAASRPDVAVHRATVVRVEETANGVAIQQADGRRVLCRSVLIASGAWAAHNPLWTEGAVTSELDARRTFSVWFGVDQGVRDSHVPAFVWQLSARTQLWGTPHPSDSMLKVGISGHAEALLSHEGVHANWRRAVTTEELEGLTTLVANRFQGVDLHLVNATPCMKAIPHSGAITSRVSQSGRVQHLNGLGGSGFKHAPALAEAAVRSALNGD